MILKIIHCMWLDRHISNNTIAPKKYNKFIESFNKHNPEFNVEFWNMDRVKKLFGQYPEIKKYKHVWENLPQHIQKCDMARFIVIYLFGGLYIDLDFMCFKNLSPLLNRELLLVCEPVEHSEMFNDDIRCRLYNGFIGSVPKQKFWLDWLDFIIVSLNKRDKNDVLNTTGPINFRRFFDQSKYKNTQLVDTCDILPLYNDRGSVYVAKDCAYKNDFSKIANDDYHKKIGNYVHTKWVEGSGWGAETLEENPTIEKMDNTRNSNMKQIFWWFLLIVLIIAFIIVIYMCFKSRQSNRPNL